MQQASKVLKCFGLDLGVDGITSTRHVVHDPRGEIVGEWGLRKWGRSTQKAPSKRQNVHVARQALRRHFWEGMGKRVNWDHRFVSLRLCRGENGCGVSETSDPDNHNDNDIASSEARAEKGVVEMVFERKDGQQVKRTASVVVGADGIRSAVRKFVVNDDNTTPLRFLGCIVVLGIVSLENVSSPSPLLDGATVFQTADGTTRLYSMPFSQTDYMWQLSFPMDEADAKRCSQDGPAALKEEALKRCGFWHDPIPQLLHGTPTSLISGYPVYDRAELTKSMLHSTTTTTTTAGPHDTSSTVSPQGYVTLLGDAAHPMSPFKGQGANQAMLDALELARALYREDDPRIALDSYHSSMLARSAVKVKASAKAAQFLHTDLAIQKGNVTRGAAAAAAAADSTADKGNNTESLERHRF